MKIRYTTAYIVEDDAVCSNLTAAALYAITESEEIHLIWRESFVFGNGRGGVRDLKFRSIDLPPANTMLEKLTE